MIRKIISFIILISVVFSQEKGSWLLSDQTNISKLDYNISQIFFTEFERMESSYDQLYDKYVWSENSSSSSYSKSSYNIKLENPVTVKQFQPTWEEVLSAYGGYGGASDAGITKNNLDKFSISIIVTALNFISNKNVTVQLEIVGEDRAIEYYNIENIERKYSGKYSLPHMSAQDLYDYGEKIKKNENQMPYITIRVEDKYLYGYNREAQDFIINNTQQQYKLKINLDKINSDFRKKLTINHELMIQIVDDLVSDEYYESLDHRVKVRQEIARTEREKRMAAERKEREKRMAAERKAEAEEQAKKEKAENARYETLKKANDQFNEDFYDDALSMTHSFFLSPNIERYELIDDYMILSQKIADLSGDSLEDLLNQKENLYSPLSNKYDRHVISEDYSEMENQYNSFLELKIENPDGDTFYKELEFASEVTDDLVMLSMSYLNKPKDDRIEVINNYLYFIIVQAKNQTPEQNKRSHQRLRKEAQPFIDQCCATRPYKYSNTNTKHIFKHGNARNPYEAKVAKKEIWENSPYFLAHGFLRFLVKDADYYRKKIGDKKEDAFQELDQNFAEIDLQVPLYFQIQKQQYNPEAIKDTHQWLKKKFDRYGDKGGSDKGNGLQYLYGAIVEMSDVDLMGIRKEDENFYNLWHNVSTFSNQESTGSRINQMNRLYKFYFE